MGGPETRPRKRLLLLLLWSLTWLVMASATAEKELITSASPRCPIGFRAPIT